MNEITALEAAIDELREPDRLLDLYLLQIRGEGAPADLIEQAERLRRAHRSWQEQ